MFALQSRKSQVIWDHTNNDSQVEKIILSSGEVVVPVEKEKINTWESLDNFLFKNHRSELTLWGKFCRVMNM